MINALLDAPTNECELSIWHLGGAISDVDADASTYRFRDAKFLLTVEAGWDGPAKDHECVAWARESWDRLRESSSTIEGFYSGFPGFVVGEEYAQLVYGENYTRLASVMAEYDPDGIFERNPNTESV